MKETDAGDFKSEVPTILSNRVNDMYILIFKTFKFDVTLVSKYIEFCSKNVSINKLYTKTY